MMVTTFRSKIISTVLLASLLFSTLPANSNSKNSTKGFLDFNLYPYLSDVDNDNTLTINMFSGLKNRFSYFALLNIGNQKGEDELRETNTFYTEQNIRWKISESSPIDLITQLNFRTGEDNDRHRFGFRWRLHDTVNLSYFFKKISMKWDINFHLLQFDQADANIWQMEHVFKLSFPYISERLYLAGFVDHTFNEDLPTDIPSNPVVTETQLGYRIYENFYVVTEYRVNQYRRSNVNNLAIGLQYKLQW